MTQICSYVDSATFTCTYAQSWLRYLNVHPVNLLQVRDVRSLCALLATDTATLRLRTFTRRIRHRYVNSQQLIVNERIIHFLRWSCYLNWFINLVTYRVLSYLLESSSDYLSILLAVHVLDFYVCCLTLMEQFFKASVRMSSLSYSIFLIVSCRTSSHIVLSHLIVSFHISS